MRKAETNKGTMNMTVKKLLTVLTAALLIVLPMQGISAANAAGVDVSLSTFEIDGTPVEDGDVILVPTGTSSVVATAVATDPSATVHISHTDLQPGNNAIVVTVTGSDTITTATYAVTVYVNTQTPEFSTDTTLASLKVNGSAITPGQTFEVAALTTAVTVEAVPTDANATSVVTGTLNLVTGMNTVSVTVTAEDGTTTQVYNFKVRVLALSSDVALDTFTVNGQAVRNGGRVYLAPGTTGANVVALPSDPSSTVTISPTYSLVAGANTITVTVTSQSGAQAVYTVTLNVQTPSSNSALVVFKVSGARVADGTTVFVPAGTTAVAVTAIAADAAASVDVNGSNGLVLGENTLTVIVTAEDGSTTTSSVTLNVLANDDTSLALFQYDGSDVTSGESFDLENGVTSVEITAEPTTQLSTVEIIGEDALIPGRNVVKVQVTAQDTSVTTYLLIFNVAPNVDTTLESLTVGGQDATGGAVTLPAGTRAAAVVAVTTDPFASYVVEGNAELSAGENTVTVTVTAADGETTDAIEVTVTVEEVVLSDVTTLASLTVGGLDATSGAVTLPAGSRAAVVVAETTDPFASYVVEGNAELSAGENTVTVTVTAANGEATDAIEVTVTVEEVILSDDVTLETFLVNGVDGLSGEPIDLPYGTTRVNVKASTTDATASYIITGDGRLTPLVEGENTLTLTVTAANGDSESYDVTLNVLPISTNNNIDPDAGLFVNGEPVDLEFLDNDSAYVNLPITATTVSIQVKAESDTSDVVSSGKTMLPNAARVFGVERGVNEINIQVIPQAGLEVAKTYKLKVYVGGADATLKTVKVNTTTLTVGEDGTAALQTPLANGIATATIFVEPTVAEAVGLGNGTKLDFDGGEATVTKGTAAYTWNVAGLVTGENTISLTVTPGDANAEPASYSIVIPVALSPDKRLKTFTLNGAVVAVGSVQALAKGTTSIEIDGSTESDVATYEVSGGDSLVTGRNTLTITVTAEDGTTQAYTVTAIVPKQVDTIVIPFPKVGVVTVDKKTNVKGNAAITAALKKIKGTVGVVKITNNFLIAKDKVTAGPLRATNTQKYLAALKTNGFKTAVYQLVADPNAKKAKGTTVTIFSY